LSTPVPINAPVEPVVATTTEPTPPAAAPPPADPPVVEPVAAADQGDEGDKGKPAETKTDGDDKPLGPAGEKALGAWKERAKAAEAALAARTAALAEAEGKLKDVGLPEQEAQLAAAKREAAQEATATVTSAAQQALVAAALFAEAKGRLADPEDAKAFLDLSDFRVGEDFTIDRAAIAAAVDGLLARKPHLASAGPTATGAPVVPAVGITQGVRERNVPNIDQRIAEMESKGDFAGAMALKSNQLFKSVLASKSKP